MARYRKKPVVVEAVRYVGPTPNEFSGAIVGGEFSEIPEWLKAEIETPLSVGFGGGGELYIETLEGTMRAAIGDYIIRGIRGELYPCKPDIFHATYEEV